METLVLKLVNLSITASWLVLAVIALRLLFRRAPRWIFCLLWGLVALRLVCPISIESALSLIPSARTLPAEILYTDTPQIDSGIRALNNAVNPVLEQILAPSAAGVSPVQSWMSVFSRVWAAGAAAMAIYALISCLLLKRRVDTATLFRENIRQSEWVDSPFVLGILCPVIYLPYKIEEEDLEYVIAHERAHICRKDHCWKLLGFALLSVYWFNPLLWAAYALLCRDIEGACDQRVIREMGKEERRGYATALLHCSVRRRAVTICPLAFGEVGVKNRIKAVMHYRKPAFWMAAAALACCAMAAVCFLTEPFSSRAVPQKLAEDVCVEISIQAISVGDYHEYKLLTVTDEGEIDQLVDALSSTTFKKTLRRFREAPDNLAAVVQLLHREEKSNENNTILSLVVLADPYQRESYSIYTTFSDEYGETYHLVAHQPAELTECILSFVREKFENGAEAG